MLTAVVVFTALAAGLGALLGMAAVCFKVETDPVAAQIDALLPQTQCGQCGYAGCRPYAEAIAAGEAEINGCPPGGQSLVRSLADLLGLDPQLRSAESELTPSKKVAVIEEQDCIGCTLCVQACPVDAILGTAKHMHTVIAQECTGCELCLAPCPVDCISLIPVQVTLDTWKWPSPEWPRALMLTQLAGQPQAAGSDRKDPWL
jgi:electron transport complex protein RnfB